MKYFIVDLLYLVPLERVAEVVDAHRAYLDEGYAAGTFLASGPKNPKTGGLVIARAEDRKALVALLEADPFNIQGIAAYTLIEFEPVKRHPEMGAFFAPAGD